MRDFTEIVVVLDKSGSMHPITMDTIKSFNGFVQQQKDIGDNASLSLYLFDTIVTVLYEGTPIKEVKPLDITTYLPGGGTALNDAVGRAIHDLGERLRKFNESERPNKQVMVIITDGEENSSRNYTHQQVKDMIVHQEQKYNWQFLFLGANIDAFQVGGSYGISMNKCFNFEHSARGVASGCYANSNAILLYRTGLKASCDYDDIDKVKNENLNSQLSQTP